MIPYRLHAGLAKRDDTAPGIELANDDRVGGRLRGSGLDSLDLYRFSVTRRSDLEVRLRTTHDFDVSLITDGGNRLGRATGGLEERIGPGRYFIAVRARNGDGGGYTLSRLARTITRSRMLVDGARSGALPAGGSAALQLRVSQEVDGPATFTVERFDPLAGWLFDTRFTPRVRGGLAEVLFRAADRRALARDRVVRRHADRERQRGRHRALPGDGAADGRLAAAGLAARREAQVRAASGCRACGP